ncbi:helix-turn-helix domain-containing protein [Streptomyces virginiae]|uniref:helix-turn-helix domain-containing protein n=1 Tax=Streptomyces virginiae TaxID=1961 RepID=UPI0035E07679
MRAALSKIRCGPSHALRSHCARASSEAQSEAKDLTMCESLLSVPRVAQILDISRRSVYRYITSGELSVVDLRTGNERSRVRIPSKDVHELVRRRTAASPRR